MLCDPKSSIRRMKTESGASVSLRPEPSMLKQYLVIIDTFSKSPSDSAADPLPRGVLCKSQYAPEHPRTRDRRRVPPITCAYLRGKNQTVPELKDQMHVCITNHQCYSVSENED